MKPSSDILFVAAFAAVSAWGTMASADVPGPKPVCDAEGLECSVCWRSYGARSAPDPSDPFEQCAQPLRDKGWTEACRNRQGAGDNVWFCAPGVKPEVVTRGGGCGGCVVGADAELGGVGLVLALSVGALLVSRRRERR